MILNFGVAVAESNPNTDFDANRFKIFPLHFYSKQLKSDVVVVVAELITTHTLICSITARHHSSPHNDFNLTFRCEMRMIGIFFFFTKKQNTIK